MTENIDKFIEALSDSLEKQTFVKLTLGNYKGADEHLQKILVRLVSTKKGTRLFFLYRSETRDTAKNYDVETGIALISEALDTGFKSGHLFTTENDFQLDIGKKTKSRFNTGKPTFPTAPPLEHNREKTVQIDSESSYLKALGITDDNGRIRDKQQDKWRQINKFVEILASLVDKSELKDAGKLRIVDMGCGKGYLTFAAYDYFKNTRNIDVQMTGVDAKSDLVDLCNGIATACQFDALNFVVGSIGDYEIGDVIQTFCSLKYGVTFPIMEKIEVNGKKQSPLYAQLNKTEPTGNVSWNFEKFLVGKDGAVIGRYKSKVAPESPELVGAIENALKA